MFKSGTLSRVVNYARRGFIRLATGETKTFIFKYLGSWLRGLFLFFISLGILKSSVICWLPNKKALLLLLAFSKCRICNLYICVRHRKALTLMLWLRNTHFSGIASTRKKTSLLKMQKTDDNVVVVVPYVLGVGMVCVPIYL